MAADSPGRGIRIESLDPKQIEILRRMSPEERIRRGLEWSDFVISSVRGRIRDAHPDWSEEEISAEVVRQLHGVEL